MLEKIKELEKYVGVNNAIVVNSTMEVMDIVEWTRATTMVVSGNAYTVLPRPDQFVRSSRLVLPKPLVISLNHYVSRSLRKNDFDPDRTTVSYSSIHVRDNYICQYCGEQLSRSEATADHILPRSRGGKSTWNNLCTACKSCNNRKGDRTPREAGFPTPKIQSFATYNRLQKVQDVFYEVIS